VRRGGSDGLAGEVGGTDDARVLPELRNPDLREGPVTAPGQGPLEGRTGRVQQQVTRLRYAAADHEARRVQDRG
jgi:hypothetical protein